jgi:cell division protein ZapE
VREASRKDAGKTIPRSAALVELDRVHADLLAAQRDASTPPWWRVRRPRPAAVRGLYMWGDVGRGKTFLVDLLFQSLPLERSCACTFTRVA